MPRRIQTPRKAKYAPTLTRTTDRFVVKLMVDGNIFQGELSLEQLFFNRPIPSHSRFRTPIRDLWLAGSSAHPGGGIMGAPGRIAALEVLRTAPGKRDSQATVGAPR